MGAAVLLQTLPVLLLAPWGGVLADRLPGRPVLLVTQLSHAFVAATLAIVALGGHGGLAAVYALSLCGGVVAAVEGPVMGRFNATIVDRRSLSNAIALGSVINSTGRVLGMGAGGVLVATLSPGILFLANAVSFVAVVVALLRLRSAELFPLEQDSGPRVGLGGVAEGLRYLVRQHRILVMLALAVVLGALGRNYQVTMAAMSAGPLQAGPGGYAMLSTVFAIGTVLGGLVAARRGELGYRSLVGIGLIASLAQLAAGLAPNLFGFAGLIVPIAIGAVLIDACVGTRMQLDSHAAMRGRVLAAGSMASAAAGAIGAPLLGFLAEQLGPRQTLVLAGAATIMACGFAGVTLARVSGIPVSRNEIRLTVWHTLGRRVPAPVPALAMATTALS
jgi:MFS family permease